MTNRDLIIHELIHMEDKTFDKTLHHCFASDVTCENCSVTNCNAFNVGWLQAEPTEESKKKIQDWVDKLSLKL